MPQTHPTDARPAGAAPAAGTAARTALWVGPPGPAPLDVAVLMTGVDDPATAARAYRSVLPRAQLWLFDDGLPAPARDAAARAGARLRTVPPSNRDALVRRMLAEVEADVYVLAHGAGADDACVAALLVAEVEAGRDLVDARRCGAERSGDLGDRLLCRAVDFLYGAHGDTLHSDFKACSRRFAVTYRQSGPCPDGSSARALALHALRLRLPVSQVATLGTRPPAAPGPARGIAGWAALLALVARLAVEERPRRIFGTAGLVLVAAGLAIAEPSLGNATWPPAVGAGTLTGLACAVAGIATGMAGLLLDALAAARQEVRRVGAAAIPRRRPAPAPQSSVS